MKHLFHNLCLSRPSERTNNWSAMEMQNYNNKKRDVADITVRATISIYNFKGTVHQIIFLCLNLKQNIIIWWTVPLREDVLMLVNLNLGK